jgi:hypothetical protein
VRIDRPVEFEDVSMASVIFENRAVATVINSLVSPNELSRVRIDTTGGSLEVNHLYGYRDADWTFHPAPDQAKASKLGLDPGARSADGSASAEVADATDPWTASAGEDVPSNHVAQIRHLVDDLRAGREHETTLASTRPTMEFVTALYASAITGGPVNRADLVPGHPFYTALNGGVDQATLARTFSI